ncbi:hypothetical protein [Bosea sp. (in: a-proteobacteria)]|jgi:hypothetical protein|uniref:hypothetical protein n=1 Tax=Bosea sp. (in: a-proteobacteria) TaxID=1871050 RepID=UPI002DDD1279|nr:hypothetical protein [Bosea sp. (in: a-proteobacteria)]HEV2513275.1 hypothetical protein [Bosea sp. (in: a-proteobacteria)]
MRLLALVLLAGLSLLWLGEAFAVERLTGEQMRQLVEGNTATGRYSSGETFSEYHHPDGRVSGYNRDRATPNRDACWTTTEAAICYYYGPIETRQTYCFTVERSGTLYVPRSAVSGSIIGAFTVQPGDPEKHADKVPAWYCDGLISQGKGRGRLAGR